jgi:hypothetical protein
MTSNRSSLLPKPASDMINSSLARGIHAAAQPLAVLLASLSKEHTDRMSNEELRELTESSAAEVRRLCTLFSGLQQLVMAQSIEPQLSPTPVVPLLAHAVEGVILLFQRDGMSLRSTVPDTCQPVLINRATTLQALTRVLLAAHAVSHPKDTVELIASSSSNGVQIVVQNASSTVAAMNPETSLSMAVAEANIRSQQAGISWSPQPFNVQIELRKVPSAY